MRLKYATVLSVIALVIVAFAISASSALGLPAYAAATGQACAACHINPAGGGPRNAMGQAFEAIPTHATDPAGAWAAISNPTPAPAPAPAPAASSAAALSIAGWVTDDSVTYEITVRNTTNQAIENLYLAGSIPAGAGFGSVTNTPAGSVQFGHDNGGVSWVVPTIARNGVVGPFGYTVSKGTAQDLSASAFAHWTVPSDAVAVSASLPPISAAEKAAVDQSINDKLNTANNSLALWSLQAGNGPRMVDLARDINLAWFAGQAKNWTMAEYEMDDQFPSDVNKLKLRNPGIAPSMSNFQTTSVQPVLDAIKANDLNAFTAAYDNMVAGCNSCHSGREDSKSIKIIRPTAPIIPEIDFSGNQ